RGTRKVFKEKIPGAAKKVVSGPGRYFKRKRELKRFKKQVAEEVKARMSEFADIGSHPGGMSGTITDVDLSDSPKEHVSFRVEKETDFAPDEPQKK
ncbi:hypothetical protein GOV11_04585, partial [Candidatus Woesearchaeota archaeon]|nr:hypothetical protein [Candidatus Woesearchaeota archaeon]